MKKTITTLLLVSAMAGAQAQKGTFMLYGDGNYTKTNYTLPDPNGFSTATNTNSPYDSWSVFAGVGYSVSDHVMFGVQGGYSRGDVAEYGTVNNIHVITRYQQRMMQIAVFGRYTQWVSKHIFVYGQLVAGHDDDSYSSEGYSLISPGVDPYSNSLANGNETFVSLFPAVGAEIARGYGVHMDIGGISYTSYINAPEGSINTKQFNVTLGQQFSFGIHKIIGWKKYRAGSAAPKNVANS